MLLASSPTLDGIEKLVNEFYCSTGYHLEAYAKQWFIYSGDRQILNVRVYKKKNRYYFKTY